MFSDPNNGEKFKTSILKCIHLLLEVTIDLNSLQLLLEKLYINIIIEKNL